jgi:MoxR-like ATPase
MSMTQTSQSDVEAAQALARVYEALQSELGKVIVGQKSVIDEILMALFARGHCLVQGVPGLAKTLMCSTLARALDLSFRRIQFTPDLMPSDITGTDVLQEDPETQRRGFEFARGPVFANLLLADEINRTPPKTQAALLQAMQERQVTAGGDAEPDRAGGDVSAAGSAAGSVHVHGARGVSGRGGRAGGSEAHDRRGRG